MSWGRPEDTTIWSSIKLYKGPCPTFLGCPLPTSWGRWNMASWRLPKVIPRDVPYRRLEDLSYRRYKDASIWSKMLFQPTFWGHPKDVLIWFYKTKKRLRDKDFCMTVALLKLSPQNSRLTMRKEGKRITYLILNNKTYIYITKIFMKYYLIFNQLIIFFHHKCLILQQN